MLGQPNQEDLIETLGRKADLNSQEMMETFPRLSAWHAKAVSHRQVAPIDRGRVSDPACRFERLTN